MIAEGRRFPAPHALPRSGGLCLNNTNLGNSCPDDEGALPPTRTPLQQPSFPKLVRHAATKQQQQQPPSPPAARALSSLPVRKKASTSESAAPPSSAAPSGGFMTRGGRPRAAGGRRSLGPRVVGRPVGGGRGAQRPRPQSQRPRGFEGGRWAAGLGLRTPSLPQTEARGGLGAPAAGSPMVPPSPGHRALAACCVAGAGARGQGPGCLGARCPPAAAAGSPLRPSACLYCSALLSSLLFIFPPPSHPPCLPTSSLPRSLLALSLARYLPPSLALSLSGSPSGSRGRRHRFPGSSPGSRSLSPGQQ